ncbi:hypothetical protein KR009_003832 [Drosophila setifemur]|nr:hypothetical protein KR009_003832 [Drosophila setifemur]
MKFLIAFVALFALAVAAPPQRAEDAVILRQDADVGPESYQYNWETSDGQSANSEGVLNNVGSDHESLAVKGSFSFIGDDGQTYTINYIADENGFQPQGAHLPVAPEA